MKKVKQKASKKNPKTPTNKQEKTKGREKGGKNKSDRCDWIHYQTVIEEKYLEHVQQKGKIPTATWLAEACNMDRSTISDHLKKFDFSRVRRRMGLLLKLSLDKLAQNATKKNPFFKDVELLYKIANQLVTKVEHSGRIDYRSFKDKLNNEGDGDFERAKKLSQILISENLI